MKEFVRECFCFVFGPVRVMLFLRWLKADYVPVKPAWRD